MTATVDSIGEHGGAPAVERTVSTRDHDGVEVLAGRAAARIEA